ncbi:hypothetical protein EB796_021573 [Bugula neritina]|uniref:Josephin-2 n=1 Tax=Bugula neritina TaxID=10212 RepID=A0A7J7J3A5_BUGNE|nr:hypothetical protein EB796_021573 [Bugula neritina]
MKNRVETESANGGVQIYHERQEKELCAIHAMNNLFQRKAFVQKDIDKLCYQLSPSTFFNPHRSMFGTGNYDVNVIMAAMESQGHEVIWFDKRRNTDELQLENIEGFILNIPSDYKLGGLIPLSFNRKHWVAIRKIVDTYYNLDSKLKSPDSLGDSRKVLHYLQTQLLEKERELLIIVKPEIHKDGSWKRAT